MNHLDIFSVNKETDLKVRCHFVSVSCMCAAVSVIVVTDWHWHGEKSATPCLHICSCSDRNNIWPSLLHPYLVSYFTAGSITITPWGSFAKLLYSCACHVVISQFTLHAKLPSLQKCQEIRVLQSWAFSCFSWLAWEQIPVFCLTSGSLSHIFPTFGLLSAVK